LAGLRYLAKLWYTKEITMVKDAKAENPKATSKTVVLTLKIDADNMTELYGRIATLVASVENSADIVSVEVKEKSGGYSAGQIGIRRDTF
jgi:hypothetical protein